jgi:hypothetical protein
MEAEKLACACEQLLSLDTAELSDAYYYTALPLCVIDAVFSIGVKYAGVENTVKRYCRHFGLKEFDRQRDALDDTQTVSEFVDEMEQIGIEQSADVIFQNHQRTSSRNGILKAEAVLRFAKVLKRYGVDSLSDLRNRKLTDEAEREIKDIPGQKSGLALQYFYMLSGDDNLAKPDRHVLKFLEQCTGEKHSVVSAQKSLSGAVELLRFKYPALTVRLLDYTIWNYMARGLPHTRNRAVHTYNKLVRDRIPEIIEASGKSLHLGNTVGRAVHRASQQEAAGRSRRISGKRHSGRACRHRRGHARDFGL